MRSLPRHEKQYSRYMLKENLILSKHLNIFSSWRRQREVHCRTGLFPFPAYSNATTKLGEREKRKDFPTFDCDCTLSTNKSSSVHEDSSKEQFDFPLKSTGVHPMSLVLQICP